ncbi:MAG: hypothetical protein AAF253_01705 [Pseudomonadota bacterium]
MDIDPHPSDNPDRAAPWTALFALIEAVTALLGPVGNGGIEIPVALRRRIRLALRAAEGQLRRLLLPEAEALLQSLPPAPPAPHQAASVSTVPALPAPGTQTAPEPSANPSRAHSDPFRFRLHEAAETTHPPARKPSARPDPLHDPYGIVTVPAQREFLRLARLIAAATAPARAIYRLALILRRRLARGLPKHVWPLDWQPRTDLDLSTPWRKTPPPEPVSQSGIP